MKSDETTAPNGRRNPTGVRHRHIHKEDSILFPMMHMRAGAWHLLPSKLHLVACCFSSQHEGDPQ